MWIYEELCTTIHLPDAGNLLSYGLIMVQENATECFRYPDLTTNRADLLALLRLLDRNQVSRYHVMDVVEDVLFVY
jgi:hypothetical protein